MLGRMSESQDTRLWHPFADMGAVRNRELVIDRGEDVWVWDAEGRRYLDATASLWYCNVGHGRPEIAEAVAAQLGRLEAYSAFGDFGNAPARALAERLASRAPMRDARVFRGSGGGDGIDTAAIRSAPTRATSSRSASTESCATTDTSGTSGPQLVRFAGMPASEVP